MPPLVATPISIPIARRNIEGLWRNCETHLTSNDLLASQEYLTIKPKPMIIQDHKNILERNDGRVDLSSLDIWVLERDQMIYLRNQSAASQEHLKIKPEPMIIQDRKNMQERDDGRVELSYLDIWELEREKRCRKVSTIWAFEREMGERYRL
ncbi:hypothetical protein AMTRI_Chr02g260390 [Amborella trichopoda]